jgi:cytoskeleton protein RodZ
VFEIGNSLREARIRRGVDFAQAEGATKIRGKYLRALEDEQFALLPSQTYVKGFLRTYAEYLGLDGQLYVDEFNSRYVTGADEHEPRTRRSAARTPQRRHRKLETNVVLFALAAIAVLTVIVFSAWKASGGGSTKHGTTPTTTAARTATTSSVVPPMLQAAAVRGSSHLIVHRGSATGTVLFDGTLTKGGDPVAIRGSRLWVSIDTPENLSVLIRGHPYTIPGAKPQVGIISRTGWHSLSE